MTNTRNWILAALITSPLAAQGGAVGFAQACLDATRDAVVLNVAAHPDDEAARTMVMLRHKYGLRTVTVYTTCGGGGQNAVGREIGERLAAIRIRETLAAAKHTGTEVRWLGFEDFGYSKSREETIAHWGGEAELLKRMAAVVDEVHPDLVITNHGLTRGHGHHQASAWAIREICKQRKLPLLERVFEGPAPIVFDAREVDPVRGNSYAEQAYDGWREHATQGPWSGFPLAEAKADKWTPVNDEAKALGDDPVAKLPSMFDAELFGRMLLGGGNDPQRVQAEFAAFAADRSRSDHVREARRLLPFLREFRIHDASDDATHANGEHPVSGASLRIGERMARRIDALERVVLLIGERMARRIDALERVVLLGSGASFDVALTSNRIARGQPAKVVAALRGLDVDAKASVLGGESVGFERGVAECSFTVPTRLPVGDRAAELMQSVRVPVVAEFELEGVPFRIQRFVEVPLGPTLRVDWPRPAMFVPSGAPWERVVSLEVESFAGEAVEHDILFRVPRSVTVETVPAKLKLDPEHSKTRIFVRLRGDGTTEDRFTLRARIGDATPELLEVQPLPASATESLRVALVRGPDDTTERFLADLGVAYEALDETELAVADLSEFTTLLLDIRAYHHRPDLANHRDRIFAFYENGGRVVACYHKPREWNERPGKPSLAPLELHVGNQRVSEEDAAVEILEPEHALLTKPFGIDGSCFEGWVQERGLNFPDKWDPDWRPLLRMHDTGEKPLDTSLLVLPSESGKGEYVYCSLALYRQIRAGHAGAARLLINLLTP
ncbi:MAG: PIG-L family deacetylase [Planctomycetes bacterium]|nr:PIG-L family deacetylase [Planctomycetota bacterium]